MRQVWFRAGTLVDMGTGRGLLSVLLAAALTAGSAICPAVAHGAPKAWQGAYQMLTYASQKDGTSAAARQRESDFGGRFTLATRCSVRSCVATVVDGPRPGNPTVPWPARYTWNGSEWTASYDWMWDCLVGGGQKTWAKATSWSYYQPQTDGSLKGTWHTDISEGPCRGSVVMPVAALPA
jgi:hypothetical protein